jgi:hypothetical protein
MKRKFKIRKDFRARLFQHVPMSDWAYQILFDILN